MKTLSSILATVIAPLPTLIDKKLGQIVSGAFLVAAGVVTGNSVLIGLGLFQFGQALAPGIPKPETTETSIKTSRPPRVSGTGRGRLHGAYFLYETAEDGTAVDGFAIHDGVMASPTFYLGDEVVTLTGNTVDEGDDGRYRDGAVNLYWTDGSTPGDGLAAIETLVPDWEGRGDGVVLLALTAESVKVKRFQETYPQSQVPNVSMVANWGVFPDPAAVDPTDEGSWTWSENPVRHLLWYKLVHEGADYATKIAPTIQYWIDAAADCDSNMSLAAGGTEDRYRSCVAFKHTDQHKDVIGAFLSTFDGWIAPRADGALVVYSGRYYEPTVSIGPTEIVAYTWDGAGIDDNDAVNEIIVTYVSAAHDYNTVEGEAWRDEDDISARGQEFSQPLEVQVPSFPQARRLSKRTMARAMAPARGTITTNVAGRRVRGQRYITLHIEEAGTTFYEGPAEIVALTRNIATGGVTFSWIAADPDIDDWDAATEEGEPAAEGDRVAPPSLTAPTITAVSVIEGPRFSLTVSSPDREDLTWFGHTRVSGATVWGTDLEYSEVSSGTSVTLVTDIVPYNATIEVQVRYQTGDGRFSAWSATSSTASVPTPSHRATGAVASGSGDINPALPAGILANDILILVVETANQAVAAPAGWTQVTNSPQGVNAAGGTTASGLQMFWKRVGASETAPTVSGVTDHKSSRIYAFKDCVTTGDPTEAAAGDTNGTASTSVTIPAITTLGASRLVFMGCSRANDDNSTTAFSAWTNANLAGLTGVAGAGTTTGNGGGFGVAYGVKAAAGSTGTTAATVVSTEQARLILALKPVA